jgi:peroxiredoxin Q/BCP
MSNNLTVGNKAPNFSLMSGDGTNYNLSDFKGKKLVLYFYPKDDTSGCTKEACSFRDGLAEIKKKGAVVVGVSPDSEASHQKFSNKYDLNFPLLSDESKKMLTKYGVWQQKSMYGRKYMGVVRTTFVINEKGVVTHIFPKVKVDGHSEDILKALSE